MILGDQNPRLHSHRKGKEHRQGVVDSRGRYNAREGSDNKENSSCQRICSSAGGPSTLGGLVAAGAACIGAGLVRRLVKKQCSLQEELYVTRQKLSETDERLGELSLALETVEKDLEAKDVHLRRTIEELESKSRDLERERQKLEEMRGELGVSQSKMASVERELEATKRLLASYQNHLDQARYDLESSREMYSSGIDPCSITWPSTRSEVISLQRLQRPKRNVVAKSKGDDAGSSNNDRSENMENPKIRRFLDNSWGVSAQLVRIVTENVGALLLVFLVTESTNFVANRVFHRLTNELAVSMLGISLDAIGNPWWLSANPALDQIKMYQIITGVVFVVAFPLNVLIRTFQSIYFFLLCKGEAAEGVRSIGTSKGSTKWKDTFNRCKLLFPSVISLCSSVLLVELFVSVVVVPLQFASLLVFTLPITLPLIMSVQISVPVAIEENVRGLRALQRSRELMKPIKWGASLPFVGIIVSQRLVEMAKEKIIQAIPQRFYFELIEIPLAIIFVGTLTSLFLAMARNLMPYACYVIAKDELLGTE